MSMLAHLTHLRTAGVTVQTAADVGAYEGEFTRDLLRVWPEARVLAVEPQAKKAHYFKLLGQQFPSLVYSPTLLGAASAEATFYEMDTPSGSTGSSVYPEESSFSRTPRVMTQARLADVAFGHSFAHFDLVKLDVQGAELDVLRGLGGLLPLTRVLLLELSTVPYNRGAPLLHETLGWLAEQGFLLYDVCGIHRGRNGTLIQTDGIFLRHDDPLRHSTSWAQ